jgi:metal-responsive CopG/Arc/MetJ family transcriptional regulator
MHTIIRTDKNTSVRYDSIHLAEVDKLAVQLGTKRSEILRVAISYFLENKTNALSNLN